nr:MAG TPA: NADH-PPase NADH pyrophosphatase zinc ribbon domain [Caudoviricetes sp.]
MRLLCKLTLPCKTTIFYRSNIICCRCGKRLFWQHRTRLRQR